MKFAAISASSSGDNTVVSAVTGKKICVLNYTAIAAGSVSATWKSGASTSLSGAMPLAANGGAAPSAGSSSPLGQVPLFETAQGEELVLGLSSAVLVAGHLAYVLKD